ncbi:E3 ubiquitin ligase family protein [Candidatus Uabimicrobium amorphum]|uniref:RING-type E3 ubiquitin transferase n=1 Tax=Uabimicrobium amorphum TaxID=2596890 RepID=A0A5S9F887_UABAM|nr:E3 ubiquitin ligase family protein [Candidatus Uabimicrobium amorphum]BBM88032.1 hypothetical protein UABAM_06448 [Candidatus Uabimicrobium amorphum]
MTYYVFSGITGLVGIIFWFIRGSSLKKLQQIVDTPTSTVKQLEDQLHHSKGQNASKEFRQKVELKGKIVCEKPLLGEISQQECVYYNTKVTHEFEERYQDRDSDGNVRSGTRRRSEIMTKDTRHIPFYLEDETGKIRIEGEGSDVDAIEVVNKLERHPKDNNLAMGKLVLDLASMVLNKGHRTIGYRMQESIIPLDRRLYILGEVCGDEELVVKKPTTSGASFIITTKSEEELVRSQQSTAKWMAILAYIFFIAAIVLLVLGIKANS